MSLDSTLALVFCHESLRDRLFQRIPEGAATWIGGADLMACLKAAGRKQILSCRSIVVVSASLSQEDVEAVVSPRLPDAVASKIILVSSVSWDAPVAWGDDKRLVLVDGVAELVPLIVGERRSGVSAVRGDELTESDTLLPSDGGRLVAESRRAANGSRGLGQTITTIAHKGGVGKTSVAVNLAALCKERLPGARVLLVDYNLGQSDITTLVGRKGREVGHRIDNIGVHDNNPTVEALEDVVDSVTFDVELEDAIDGHKEVTIDVLHGMPAFRSVDELNETGELNYLADPDWLRSFLDSARRGWDYIFIDTQVLASLDDRGKATLLHVALGGGDTGKVLTFANALELNTWSNALTLTGFVDKLRRAAPELVSFGGRALWVVFNRSTKQSVEDLNATVDFSKETAFSIAGVVSPHEQWGRYEQQGLPPVLHIPLAAYELGEVLSEMTGNDAFRRDPPVTQSGFWNRLRRR